MNPSSNPRHAVIRKHLDEYEAEGRVLHAELADISFQRARVTKNPVVRLTFGDVTSGSFVPEYWEKDSDYPERARPIVLHQPGGGYPEHINTARCRIPIAAQMVRASEIAYPGLKACLLMWLDQRETHARKALAAWEARDAVAEAVALLNGGEGV